MAFFSMMLVFTVIAVLFLCGMAILGIFLLVIGIVKRRKPANKGKKGPVVCIASGSVLLAIPVIIGLVMAVSAALSVMQTFFGTYEHYTDKWKYGWVSDNEARREAINGLLSAAESGDREALAKNFTEEIREKEGFSKALDDFLAAYPKGLALCELNGHGGASGGKTGEVTERNTSISYTCELDGKWYYMSLSVCHENSADKSKVGVTYFLVESLEANALDEDYPDDAHLIFNNIEGRVSAVLIEDRGYLYTPYTRNITMEQMKEYLAQYNTLSDIVDEIGEPNVSKKYDNSTGYDYYYRLASENGEPRFVYICSSQGMGKIYSYHFCSDKGYIKEKEESETTE